LTSTLYLNAGVCDAMDGVDTLCDV